MNKDEALRLALEALETCNWFDDGEYGHAEYDHVSTNKAITAIKEALAQREQLMSDQINYGMSVTQGGKRIDPMSIYKEREQDGECKHCTDGCPACDARKLPEQEPVAWMNQLDNNFFSKQKDTFTYSIALYTTPPQRTWVGLTDEEKASFWTADQMTQEEWDKLFAAIAAKLKEKNT